VPAKIAPTAPCSRTGRKRIVWIHPAAGLIRCLDDVGGGVLGAADVPGKGLLGVLEGGNVPAGQVVQLHSRAIPAQSSTYAEHVDRQRW